MARRFAPCLALPLLASLSLPLSGCYGDPESFAKTTAKHTCKRMRECERADFDEEYGGDLARCRDSIYTDFLDAADVAEEFGCEYNPDEGQACGSAVRSLRNDCSDDADREIADACEEVYDCPGLLVPEEPDVRPNDIVAESLLASWPEDAPAQ